jgi:hypothetical protein
VVQITQVNFGASGGVTHVHGLPSSSVSLTADNDLCQCLQDVLLIERTVL